MQANPIEEWQRLTEQYRQMSDEELRELSADFANLTETAQQVLRSEMQKRGLDDPLSPAASPNSADQPWTPDLNSSGDPDENQNADLPHEYTWKTALCECDDQEQASQIYEVLRRAGIESWIEQPGSSRYSLDTGNPCVLVAADQLNQARQIAAQPIPQDIIDQSKIVAPEFEPPVCPQCGDKDPVLESVDPVNSWLCEACGKQWTDPAANQNQAPETATP